MNDVDTNDVAYRGAEEENAEVGQEPVHCRLYFLLARYANTAVIFRRGPSKWVQIIRWDTANDTFEPGQWFRGRIYEKRCDLSPNGRLMIYFASKFNSKTIADDEYTYAWTAISRPPYLTALALWPKGDCWHGGGLFRTDKKVWLNHRPFQAVPHPNHTPRGLEVITNRLASGEDDPVFFSRLKRDGWILKQDCKFKKEKVGYSLVRPTIFWKRGPREALTLVMTGTHDWQVYLFRIRHGNGETALEGAEYAEWDHRGRLVFVRAGKMFAATVDDDGHIDEQELADFDGNKVDRKHSPDWAKQW